MIIYIAILATSILLLLIFLTFKIYKLMGDVTNLQTAVEAETTIDASVITLLNGFAAQLQAANGDQSAIDAVVATMKTNAANLAAAVTANTPSAS